MANFQPLLAGKDASDRELERHIAAGLLASPKIDGFRCLIRGGRAVSRYLKPIPNEYVQRELAGLPDDLDGELVVGPAAGEDVFRRTSSGVTSRGGEPDFRYLVFDRARPGTYRERLQGLTETLHLSVGSSRCEIVDQAQVMDLDRLWEMEAACVAAGYEGMMVRRWDAPYKFGRSTVREGFLLKIKRFEDREGVVVGFEEEMENRNPATTDARGHTVRSTSRANMVGKGRLGALWLRDRGPGGTWRDFTCGSGLTAADRERVWADRLGHLGRVVTYRYTPAGSTDDAPRFPIFKGFRAAEDLP